MRFTASFAPIEAGVARVPARSSAVVEALVEPTPPVPDDDAAPPLRPCDSTDPVVPLALSRVPPPPFGADSVAACFAWPDVGGGPVRADPDAPAGFAVSVPGVRLRVVGASWDACSEAGRKRSATWAASLWGRIDTVAPSPAPSRAWPERAAGMSAGDGWPAPFWAPFGAVVVLGRADCAGGVF
ncbi:hypothetical protein [Pseudonocardia sp. N23]|uniref:hypothetical protein n=1 Tax=Pseudonocardia sp. N23 TaxID=1987376 RepID=UPI001145C732|nr:hypothetical protein [Pseudonocardia sp. N23]